MSAAPLRTPRLGWVYVSHGVIFDNWKPKKIGADFEITPNLKPLESLKGKFNIITGLSHLEADTKGDGSNLVYLPIDKLLEQGRRVQRSEPEATVTIEGTTTTSSPDVSDRRSRGTR